MWRFAFFLVAVASASSIVNHPAPGHRGAAVAAAAAAPDDNGDGDDDHELPEVEAPPPPRVYRWTKQDVQHLVAASGDVLRHRLRVCNAYPHEARLDVYHRRKLLPHGRGFHYKECRDLQTPLKRGDKLDFMVLDTNAGTFEVTAVPENNAVLLLVIRRVSSESTAVAFDSHVFAGLLNPQVAVIDTFCGDRKASIKIVDPQAMNRVQRSEDLKFNNVVPVNPGVYEVVLSDRHGEVKAAQKLVALNRNSYVVLRTGLDPEQGIWFPQELVIYPQSNKALLYSAAPRAVPQRIALCAPLFLTMVVWLAA